MTETRSHHIGESFRSRAEMLTSLAGLVELCGSDRFFPALGDLLEHAVSAKDTAIIELHSNAQPKVLHLNVSPSQFDADFSIYIAGAYLIDPFYEIFLSLKQPRCVSYEDIPFERSHWKEYYDTFHSNIDASEDAGFLIPIDDGIGIHISLLRGLDMPPFREASKALMQDLLPMVSGLLRLHYRISASDDTVKEGREAAHRHIVQAYETFGSALLTQREGEIARMLVRGYSAKGIARELGISPGTVNIHRYNIYDKLQVRTHGEIFSMFLNTLLSDGDVNLKG